MFYLNIQYVIFYKVNFCFWDMFFITNMQFSWSTSIVTDIQLLANANTPALLLSWNKHHALTCPALLIQSTLVNNNFIMAIYHDQSLANLGISCILVLFFLFDTDRVHMMVLLCLDDHFYLVPMYHLENYLNVSCKNWTWFLRC